MQDLKNLVINYEPILKDLKFTKIYKILIFDTVVSDFAVPPE